MRTVTIEKNNGNYTVNTNATSGGGITSINETITTFGVEDSVYPCYLAIDSERNILTEVSELPNAFMILDVSSGGGNPRSCYRTDDSSEWDENAGGDLYYNDNCTFTLSGSDFVILPSDGYDVTTENIIVKQTPLSYISVGHVGS